jgi:hypothetical protein
MHATGYLLPLTTTSNLLGDIGIYKRILEYLFEARLLFKDAMEVFNLYLLITFGSCMARANCYLCILLCCFILLYGGLLNR